MESLKKGRNVARHGMRKEKIRSDQKTNERDGGQKNERERKGEERKKERRINLFNVGLKCRNCIISKVGTCRWML